MKGKINIANAVTASTQGEKNRPQTFYEIAIDHELSSAEAVENIYKKALEKIKGLFLR